MWAFCWFLIISLTIFIRYAKMQYQSLPGPNASLTFEDVVPKASSNAHIASSALYHCLGQFSSWHMLELAWVVLVSQRHGGVKWMRAYTYASTSHLAVLGTKDLARFDQPEAYGPIKITIKTWIIVLRLPEASDLLPDLTSSSANIFDSNVEITSHVSQWST